MSALEVPAARMRPRTLSLPDVYAAALCAAGMDASATPYMLLLAAQGNPDRQQYTYTAEPAVHLDTVRDRLVPVACRYRDVCGMGGGNWGGVCGMIYSGIDGGRLAAVTYNGRLLSTDAELLKYHAAQYPRGATYDPAMVFDLADTGFAEMWGVTTSAEARITAFSAVVRARRSAPRWLLDALDVLEAR